MVTIYTEANVGKTLRRTIAIILGGGYIAAVWAQSDTLDANLFWLALLAIFAVGINFLVYRRVIRRWADVTFFLLPALWIVGSSAAVLLVSTPAQSAIFGVLGAAVLVRLQLELAPQKSSPFLDGVFLLSAAGIYAAIWAADYYFSPGWWLAMVAGFVATLILLWYGFLPAPSPARERFFFSIAISALMAEVFWALLYLPVHFLSLTAISATIFYALWLLSLFYLSGSLKRPIVVFHLVFAGALLILVLATARWLPTR